MAAPVEQRIAIAGDPAESNTGEGTPPKQLDEPPTPGSQEVAPLVEQVHDHHREVAVTYFIVGTLSTPAVFAIMYLIVANILPTNFCSTSKPTTTVTIDFSGVLICYVNNEPINVEDELASQAAVYCDILVYAVPGSIQKTGDTFQLMDFPDYGVLKKAMNEVNKQFFTSMDFTVIMMQAFSKPFGDIASNLHDILKLNTLTGFEVFVPSLEEVLKRASLLTFIDAMQIKTGNALLSLRLDAKVRTGYPIFQIIRSFMEYIVIEIVERSKVTGSMLNAWEFKNTNQTIFDMKTALNHFEKQRNILSFANRNWCIVMSNMIVKTDTDNSGYLFEGIRCKNKFTKDVKLQASELVQCAKSYFSDTATVCYDDYSTIHEKVGLIKKNFPNWCVALTDIDKADLGMDCDSGPEILRALDKEIHTRKREQAQ